jgi:hypothetical protein
MNLAYLKKYSYHTAVYFFVFGLLLLAFDKGFDLTDEGWQLSKSWFFFKGGFAENADLIWGSSFTGGSWLSLQQTPTLLWARIGFLIFFPFLPLTVFLILKEKFSSKTAFLSVILSFLFFYRNFIIYYTINYYWLPVFSSLLSFLMLIKFHPSGNLKNIILSAVFAGVSVHFKFTYITIIPLFAFYILIFAKDNKRSVKFKNITIYYSAFLAALAAGMALLWILGGAGELIGGNDRLSIVSMFSSFFSGKSVNSRLDYSFMGLMVRYLGDLKTVIIHSAVPFILFAAGAYFFKNNRFLKYLAGFFSCLILIAYKELTGNDYLLVVGIFTALGTLVLLERRSRSKENLLVFSGFIYIFVISFAGSGMGFYAGMISSGLMGFCALVFCLMIDDGSEKFSFRSALIPLLAFILFIQYSKEFVFYREAESSKLTCRFETTELTGIYSFEERVRSVDEFFLAAAGLIAKKDKTFISGMPALYYLLDQKPVVSETYETILRLDQVKSEIVAAKPDVFILPVQSPRGNFWPLEKNKQLWRSDPYEVNSMDYYRFYYSYMGENGFVRVFQNDMFGIFRRSLNALQETE